MRLDQKKILVTGSTMGIGFAAAAAMHREGAKVAIHGRSLERVQKAIDALGGGDNLFPVVGDVGNLDDCDQIIKDSISALGGLDCLAHNAGIGDLSYLEDVTQEHFDHIINVNLRSAPFLVKAALPELKKSRGSIIFTASVTGMTSGPTDSFVYAVAKGGMISLARSLALELAPDGIRVNALCPGYINTPLIAAENAACDGQVYQFIEECVPLSRIGTVEECASTLVYLASDEAAYFTGSIVVNDGGAEANRSWGGRN